LKEIKIFSGRSHPELAKKVCQQIGIELSPLKIETYKNGCFEAILQENVRQKTVFLIQTSLPDHCSLHEHIFELLQMINAAKNCKAEQVIIVMPYISYARSDKAYAPGMAKYGELLARFLSEGTAGLIGIDFHSERFERFFSPDYEIHHLSALSLFAEFLKKKNTKDTFLLPADMGAFKKGSILGIKSEIPFGWVEKERISDTKVKIKSITGEFAGKDVVIFDDEISTGTTLKTLAEEVKKRGAKSISFLVTHGLFVGDAINNFKDIDMLKEIIVTDTVPVREEVKRRLPLKILSVDKLLAEKIKEIAEK
jgi:ribose-phosphate pyrophosphokinase